MIKGARGINIKQESYLTIVKMIKILDHHPYPLLRRGTS
jgi:hypothetical protein